MELAQIVVTNFSTLLRCLDPTNELLGNLLSVAFVKDQISVIEQKPTLDDKNYALLKALREVPDGLQKSVMSDFIAALRSCGQEHVANIFRRESDKVPMSDEHRDMITMQSDKLIEFLDPENGLLNKLVSSRVISWVNNDAIRSKVGFYNKATELISTILRKSDHAFQALINSLNETGQSHIVYILTGEGNIQPVSEDDRKKLREKRELIHFIIPHDLMPALISKGVFTSYDQERVEGQKTNDDKAEMMFDLIARKSQTAFDQFIETLRECKHEHVAEWLLGPEITSMVEANVEDVENPEVDVQNLECEISENMQQTIANDDSFNEVKEELTKNGLSVTRVLKGSIIVKFAYKHHAALISLQQLYISKKLDMLLTEAFCPQFATKGLKSLRVVIPDQRCADMYPRIDICGYPQFFADTDRIRIWFCTIIRIRIRIQIVCRGP